MIDLDRYRADRAKIDARAEVERDVLARKLIGLPPPKHKLLRERKPKPRADGASLTTEQAAEHLGCSVKTLLGHVTDGKLCPVNIGRGKTRPTYCFPLADLDHFIDQRRRQHEATPCPSIATPARHSTTATSRSGVIDIRDRLRSAASVKRKR